VRLERKREREVTVSESPNYTVIVNRGGDVGDSAGPSGRSRELKAGPAPSDFVVVVPRDSEVKPAADHLKK
jgi:hypothetical protein